VEITAPRFYHYNLLRDVLAQPETKESLNQQQHHVESVTVKGVGKWGVPSPTSPLIPSSHPFHPPIPSSSLLCPLLLVKPLEGDLKYFYRKLEQFDSKIEAYGRAMAAKLGCDDIIAESL